MSCYNLCGIILHQSFKTDCCLTNSDAHVTGGSEGWVYLLLGSGRCVCRNKIQSSFFSGESFFPFNSCNLVTSVSYHPKDNAMITSSVDGSIRVWKTE
ncbi:hypothetical protein Pint_27087 [Pistacia integerrima]|uniref:Uncharacterized protein n=1 Tax=Pistacia integerrima TaxID=434235 RepID=A0ACC0YQ94_9ROSI|nr:hypothetical protein Pint_27087 [Pistacia integerrima]